MLPPPATPPPAARLRTRGRATHARAPNVTRVRAGPATTRARLAVPLGPASASCFSADTARRAHAACAPTSSTRARVVVIPAISGVSALRSVRLLDSRCVLLLLLVLVMAASWFGPMDGSGLVDPISVMVADQLSN